MMDFEHKEKQDVLNKSVVMDKQTLDKFLLENSVEDLLKENDQKVVDNNVQQVNQEEVGNIIVNEAPLVQANVDAGNNANIFIRKPVPHLSRSLAKSMRKILKWEGKKSADAAVPVHEAINSVLHAHSESEFVDAMEELAERAVNYIRLSPGKDLGSVTAIRGRQI